MNEIAFLVMDLWHRDHADLARRFLNAYLERTGDYAGLATLPFYLVYRAMVRAKVALIRSAQPDVSGEEKQLDRSEFRRLHRSGRRILGSTTALDRAHSWCLGLGQELLCPAASGALRCHPDTLGRRAQAQSRPGDDEAASGSPIDAGLYAEAATRQTYERLAMLTSIILDAGWPVIADATFIERWQRDLFRAEALRRRVPWLILDFRVAERHAPETRCRTRRQGGRPLRSDLGRARASDPPGPAARRRRARGRA